MHTQKTAYKQIVLPGLEYCSSIWDPTQISFIHQLEMVQCKGARFVLNCPWSRNSTDHVSEMLTDLKWCPLESRRKQGHLLLMFKLLNNMVYIPDDRKPKHAVNGTRACNSIQLIRPYARTDTYPPFIFCTDYFRLE